jgi:hypothetical protein
LVKRGEAGLERWVKGRGGRGKWDGKGKGEGKGKGNGKGWRGTLVSEFRGVGGCAYDCEVGRSEEGAGCYFGCHCVCFVRRGWEVQLSRWGFGVEVEGGEETRRKDGWRAWSRLPLPRRSVRLTLSWLVSLPLCESGCNYGARVIYGLIK